MKPRTKKLIGTLALLPTITVYFFAAAALGERLPQFWLLQAVYYVFAGVIWAIPTIRRIRWMEKDTSGPEKL